MSQKFKKYREVDHRYLNVPIKYCLNYTGANEDGKDKYDFPSYEEWVKKCQKVVENFGLEWEWDFSKEAYKEEKKSGYMEKELVKTGTDKTLCIVDFYGKDKALVAWRNNNTCKMGMTKMCKVVWKKDKMYLRYRGNLIPLSGTGGWVF